MKNLHLVSEVPTDASAADGSTRKASEDVPATSPLKVFVCISIPNGAWNGDGTFRGDTVRSSDKGAGPFGDVCICARGEASDMAVSPKDISLRDGEVATETFIDVFVDVPPLADDAEIVCFANDVRISFHVFPSAEGIAYAVDHTRVNVSADTDSNPPSVCWDEASESPGQYPFSETQREEFSPKARIACMTQLVAGAFPKPPLPCCCTRKNVRARARAAGTSGSVCAGTSACTAAAVRSTLPSHEPFGICLLRMKRVVFFMMSSSAEKPARRSGIRAKMSSFTSPRLSHLRSVKKISDARDVIDIRSRIWVDTERHQSHRVAFVVRCALELRRFRAEIFSQCVNDVCGCGCFASAIADQSVKSEEPKDPSGSCLLTRNAIARGISAYVCTIPPPLPPPPVCGSGGDR